MRDRVADHQHTDVALPDALVERIVPLVPRFLVPTRLRPGGDLAIAIGHSPERDADVVVRHGGGDFVQLGAGRQADITCTAHWDLNRAELLPLNAIRRHVAGELVAEADQAHPVRRAQAVLFNDVRLAEMPCAVCGGFAAGLGARHERAAPVRQQQHRGVPRIGVERLAHHHARLGPLRTHRAHNPGRNGSLPGIFRVGKMKRIARAVDVYPLALEREAFAVVLGESTDLHVADITTPPRPG